MEKYCLQYKNFVGCLIKMVCLQSGNCDLQFAIGRVMPTKHIARMKFAYYYYDQYDLQCVASSTHCSL